MARDRIEIKTPAQIATMRRAGLVVSAALDAVAAAIEPGVSALDLDAVAAQVIAEFGATSNFLGYHGFPATTCISVNEVVVHGIPDDRVLQPGDVVSVDCGAIVTDDRGTGWHGDSARTFIVPPVDPADRQLSDLTRDAMWEGIAAAYTGTRVGDIGAAIDHFVDDRLQIVQDYTGHGIGTAMHQPPDVLHYRTAGRGPRLKPGMCLAVEPMLTRGGEANRELDDGWTVVTLDGSRAAHWEHSVALLPDGLLVLTAEDGGARELAARGVPLASSGCFSA